MHSPLGGQGLNLGIGDAMNLGWKLAAVARGDAAETLLDSYQAERHPIGARVLDWSRAQVALMRPGPGQRALAAVFADLAATRDGATYLAERLWGVAQPPVFNGEHPWVGQSVPDVQLANGDRMGSCCAREGRAAGARYRRFTRPDLCALATLGSLRDIHGARCDGTGCVAGPP